MSGHDYFQTRSNRWAHLSTLEAFERCYIPEPNSGCWLWVGSLNKGGYGRLSVGQPHRSHRLAWELFKGPIPDGLSVLHKCDVRSCVNPDHLYLGTHQQNMHDMVARDRSNKWRGSRSGENNPAVKLTGEQVEEIRRQRQHGTPASVIARKFGIAKTTVWLIEHDVTWRKTNG